MKNTCVILSYQFFFAMTDLDFLDFTDPFGSFAGDGYTLLQHFSYRGELCTHVIECSLNDWEEMLSPKTPNEAETHCRVHRSHIVSLPFVADFDPDIDGHGGYAVLHNGIRLRVSRKYLQRFHAATEFRFASAVQKRNYRRKRRRRAGAGGEGGRKAAGESKTNNTAK
jgi:hypothetical protein